MPDPIRFDVFNPQTPDAGPVIYISDDAAKWGRLTIRLTNPRTDNSDLKLEPGGVLQIYMEMLTPGDIKSIKLADDSPWAGGPDATNRHLELHPKQTIVIPSQTSVTIELHNVLGKTPRQGKFRFYVQSLGIRNAVVQGFVQRPPGGNARQWGLACVLDPRQEYRNQGNTVYVTAAGKPEIANYLLVHLYRSAGGTLPSTGTPQVSFSFLTGAGDLALCSEDRLKKVTASIRNQLPAGRWKDPAVDAQGEDTVWTVAPAAGGGDLFPEQALLTLRFDDIVTDLPAGGSAILFIQYAGLTGYDDGYIQVPLSKSAPVPYLRSFVAYKGNDKIKTGGTVDYGALKLGWEVFAADAAVLRDEVIGPSSDQTFRATDTTTVQAVTATLSYQLTPRAGDVDHPEDGGRLGLRVAPPTAKISTGLAQSGYLNVIWNCTNGSHCTLYQNNSLIADHLPLAGQRNMPVSENLTYTFLIKCHGAGVTDATVVVTAWLEECQQGIARGRAPPCPASWCEKAAGYIAAVCHQNGWGPAQAILVDSGQGWCVCCCGTGGLVAAVALAETGSSKAARDIEVGEKVRVALDGALSRWSEHAVAFSAGIGADPFNPMIEIEFGDAARPGRILAARNQLFLMPDGVLKRAAKLAAGRDTLMRADGGTAPVVAMHSTTALGGVHQIATSTEPATELRGHLIVINGVVCGDYALQANDLESLRPELLAAGHAELPEFGTEPYALQHGLP